jgi:hypothetical protein
MSSYHIETWIDRRLINPDKRGYLIAGYPLSPLLVRRHRQAPQSAFGSAVKARGEQQHKALPYIR